MVTTRTTDELDLILIDAVPSSVWYPDIVDFAAQGTVALRGEVANSWVVWAFAGDGTAGV
jgi:hypothetical protein